MGVITNYGELQAAVADHIVRTDLTSQIQDFINAADIVIREYAGDLGQKFTLPQDSNQMLAYDPYIYLWGALAEAYFYLRDNDEAAIFTTKFQGRLNDLALQGFGAFGMQPAIKPPRQLFPYSARYIWAGTPPVEGD